MRPSIVRPGSISPMRLLLLLALAPRAMGLALSGAHVRARMPFAPRVGAGAGALSCSILSGLASSEGKQGPPLRVGDSVRVVKPSRLMHVPGHKDGFDPSADGGCVGTVRSIYESGTNLSANRPIKVAFEEPKKWIGHFEAHELSRE